MLDLYKGVHISIVLWITISLLYVGLLQAKQISAAYNEKNDAKSLQQLKQFVSKLPHMQAERKSLEIQTAIAGLVSTVRFL